MFIDNRHPNLTSEQKYLRNVQLQDNICDVKFWPNFVTADLT